MTREPARRVLRLAWHRLSFQQRRQIMRSPFGRVMYRTVWAPPGHFYSPYAPSSSLHRVPDPSSVSTTVAGIDLRTEEQIETLEILSAKWKTVTVPEDPTDGWRYHLDNARFAYSDGAVLASMLLWLRPPRYVEVGSGWSTCLTLDIRERHADCIGSMTVIDPFPDKRIIDAPVVLRQARLQDIDADVFGELSRGDVLFVDSTHVSKTDSDVNHLFFEVLPLLRPGVYVHLHDVHWPFEYPKDWLLGGRAWHESYLLRAFLQFNSEYEIVIWPSYLSFTHEQVVDDLLPISLVNRGGGSIWLRRSG